MCFGAFAHVISCQRRCYVQWMAQAGSILALFIGMLSRVSAVIPRSDLLRTVMDRSNVVFSISKTECRISRQPKRRNAEQEKVIPQNQLPECEKAFSRSDKVLIVCEDDIVFRHFHKVPRSSLSEAQKILELELTRLLPHLDVALMKFQWLSPDGETAYQAVVKRESLENALAFVRRCGATVEALGVHQSDGNFASSFVVPSGKDYSSVREKPWRLSAFLAASIFVGAVLGVSYISAQHFAEAEVRALLSVTNLTEEAKKIRGAIDRQTSDKKLTDTMLRLRQQSPSVVSVWQELTKVLPDHSWIQQFSFNGEFFQIEGVSRDAEKLVPLLEESKLFKDVAFSAPVTQSTSGGGQRFAIRMRSEAGS
jgi:Tfp pilus assembly protein PilN